MASRSSDLLCGEDGVDVDLDSVFEAAGVASSLRGDDRDVALARFSEDARIALEQTSDG